MNVLQAMDDPALFGPYFKGSSWDAWRAFLAALHGLPLTDAQLATYQRHTSRTDAPAEPFAEAALICGRRGGKSRTLALLGTCLASLRDYRPFLAPGEVATVAILASDRYAAEVRQAEQQWQSRGIHAVPAVVINDRYLISGGQPPEAFEQALRTIAAELAVPAQV